MTGPSLCCFGRWNARTKSGTHSRLALERYRRFRLLSPRLRSRWRRRRAFFFLSRFSSDGFMYAMFCRYSCRTRLRFTWRRKRLSARSMSSLFRTFTPTANVDPSLRNLVVDYSLHAASCDNAGEQRGSPARVPFPYSSICALAPFSHQSARSSCPPRLASS